MALLSWLDGALPPPLLLLPLLAECYGRHWLTPWVDSGRHRYCCCCCGPGSVHPYQPSAFG